MFVETSYLTASAYEEAMKKEQARVKELEEKFQTKILENGVNATYHHPRQHDFIHDAVFSGQ